MMPIYSLLTFTTFRKNSSWAPESSGMHEPFWKHRRAKQQFPMYPPCCWCSLICLHCQTKICISGGRGSSQRANCVGEKGGGTPGTLHHFRRGEVRGPGQSQRECSGGRGGCIAEGPGNISLFVFLSFSVPSPFFIFLQWQPSPQSVELHCPLTSVDILSALLTFPY